MHQKVFILFKIYNIIFFLLDKSFTIRPIIYQNNEYKLQIWDTANDAKTNKIHKDFFVWIKGVFLIYDITNLDSFKNIKNYNKQVDENIPGSFKILIGYNCERENRAVSSEEGKKLANELKIDSFFELPSNNNERIDEMLNVILAKKFFDNKNNNCLIIWI